MSSDAQMAVEQPTVEQPTVQEPAPTEQTAPAEKTAPAEQPSPSEQPAEGASERPAKEAGAQPKKPAGGAFGRFLAESRAALAEECKGRPVTAVTKLASERFRALSEEDRQEWQEKFQEAKKKYEKDMEAFKAAGGEVKPRAETSAKRKAGKGGKDEGEGAKRRKVVDPNAPKKPVGGAFGRFVAKNRAEFQKECAGKPASAVSKVAGETWKALGEEDKKPFQEEFDKAMADYKEAMKSYTPPQQDHAGAAGPETPTKKPRASKGASGSDKKPSAAKPKARGRASKGAAPTQSALHLDASIVAEADKVGLTSTLLKLAALSDVAACGKSQADMLKALQASDGLLHPAKRVLLGA